MKIKVKENDKSEEIKNRTLEIMRNLPLGDIMSNILDAVLFGFSVGEIEWKAEGDEILSYECNRKTSRVVYIQPTE